MYLDGIMAKEKGGFLATTQGKFRQLSKGLKSDFVGWIKIHFSHNTWWISAKVIGRTLLAVQDLEGDGS